MKSRCSTSEVTRIGEYAAGSWGVFNLSISPNGKRLLANPFTGIPRVWDMMYGTLIGNASGAGRGAANGGDFLDNALVVTPSRYQAGCLELTTIDTGEFELY